MSAAVHRVRLRAADGASVAFDCPEGSSVFHAAQRAGYEMRTGCMQGRCAICRCRLEAGAVRSIRRPSRHAAADPARREDGHVLICSVTPTCDIELRVRSPWRAHRGRGLA